MATRKAPTGAKHDRCIGHVEHPYPSKGVLCYGAVIGEAGMIEFADHLAKTRAEHRAAFLDAPVVAPASWYVGTGKARKLRPIGEFRGLDVVPAVCDGTRCHGSSVHAHGQGARVAILRGNQDNGLPELVARYRAMRGMPAETETAARGPVRKVSPKVAPVIAETPAAVLEPIAETRCYVYLHTQGGTRRCVIRPDHHEGACEYEPEITPSSTPLQPAPDTYAAAVELAETRPDPCAECGHPAHGATCATCDDAAQVGTYGPCADVAAAPEIVREGWYEAGAIGLADLPPVEPIAEPAPVLSAPAPVSRPTCERCGQVFRLKGAGAEWHRLNRPDCARVAVAV